MDENEAMAAYDTNKMASKIYEVIINSLPEQMKYTPDAMIRVFVYLCKCNEWTLERTQKEVEKGINFYWANIPDNI